jgi:hypothetical protein
MIFKQTIHQIVYNPANLRKLPHDIAGYITENTSICGMVDRTGGAQKY